MIRDRQGELASAGTITRSKPRANTPVVRSLALGVPANRAAQSDVREAAKVLFPRMSAFKRLLDVFDNARIESRQLAMPLEWYLTPRGFEEKNAVYVREAARLAEAASREALERANVRPSDVDAIVFVSTSGISTPSLDSFLIERLGLSRHAARVPIFGLGCAGGAAGLARAADFVRAGFENVLFVAVELCSLTLVHSDESKSNFVGTSLFSDGAAAMVLGPDGRGKDGPALHGAYSTLIEDSADIMGWDVVNDGLKVRFSRDIPALVRSMMDENVRDALAAHGWRREDVRHFVVHPGGVKVLSAYEEALGLASDALDSSREVLREYGNMSSVTVLYVLERVLRDRPRGKGLLSAMGPGFSAEHVLLEF
ncbi:type III polyketide synthase [Deinococcus yavapaiensis]|uniref:type III polyketide synthase n=1 Tax=Deinococcus yavapaiensis TaxID=309889 RepID=UPI001FEB3214|nr:3-oxoacyl-[acyl-carrier-protein] synthase III C-terminal domain-containing protein [Deinococcus yavapaiensis]